MVKVVGRREFLARSGMAAGATVFLPYLDSIARDDVGPDSSSISFETTDAVLQTHYQSAIDLLAANIQPMPGYSKPVLIEGSVFRGIWLECAPHEGLVYSTIRPDIARDNHLAFFELQREDGQLPCNVKINEAGYGQIQMVVPVAATAWELSQQTGDGQLLEAAYTSCSRWDAWLRKYRDTRHTGLCEGFCTFDTGHDNSPRWAGIPNRCPDGDARKCPPVPSLPRLCPDLSATVYGGRVALAAMARALGRNSEADYWLELAATIRKAILDRLYDPTDAAFYDLDAQNQFVRVRGDVISRVLGEHVVDQDLFQKLYRRQIRNTSAFWAPYPLPSIALADPHFIRPIPRNSWGGASQALTALRAPRWMEHYGKPADLAHLMQQWIDALLRAPDFRQQLDPLTGEFTDDPPGYSPSALVLIDFTWRLSGVRKMSDLLEWNIRPPDAATRTSFRLRVNPALNAEIRYESGHAELRLNDRVILTTRSTVRLLTTQNRELRTAVGIGNQTSTIALHPTASQARKFAIGPNSTVKL
jgi:hypothetical protein